MQGAECTKYVPLRFTDLSFSYDTLIVPNNLYNGRPSVGIPDPQQIRVSLSWGSKAKDLDLHMIGPFDRSYYEVNKTCWLCGDVYMDKDKNMTVYWPSYTYENSQNYLYRYGDIATMKSFLYNRY